MAEGGTSAREGAGGGGGGGLANVFVHICCAFSSPSYPSSFCLSFWFVPGPHDIQCRLPGSLLKLTSNEGEYKTSNNVGTCCSQSGTFCSQSSCLHISLLLYALDSFIFHAFSASCRLFCHCFVLLHFRILSFFSPSFRSCHFGLPPLFFLSFFLSFFFRKNTGNNTKRGASHLQTRNRMFKLCVGVRGSAFHAHIHPYTIQLILHFIRALAEVFQLIDIALGFHSLYATISE